ncbi:hypothetical protein BpHYR1_001070 [Brachionus plicatilis]|uniref:Uncharacterized protein n=1 Tax=Brachionus plicatilis TaxID=10195 RepID=A0A3M7PU22_BRAPC|nr:hypothetical protein BpHYR1_001070 [Brachionus plicatilis]
MIAVSEFDKEIAKFCWLCSIALEYESRIVLGQDGADNVLFIFCLPIFVILNAFFNFNSFVVLLKEIEEKSDIIMKLKDIKDDKILQIVVCNKEFFEMMNK